MEFSFTDMIMPELLVLIPACWGIGYLIRSTKCPNRFIPFLNAIISVLLAILYTFSETPDSVLHNIFVGVTQGIVCWIVSWVSYDKFIKQGVEKDLKIKLSDNTNMTDDAVG